MATIDIFVSYSHEDKEFCHELVSALRAAGADVWCDDEQAGNSLLDTIQLEVDQRPVFIVILSQAALRSTWVRDETTWAYGFYKDDVQGRIILPVTAGTVSKHDFNGRNGWLFLRDFARIEMDGGAPYPIDQAIEQVLQKLVLTLPDETTTTKAIESSPDDLPESAKAQRVTDLLTRGKALQAQGESAKAVAVFIEGVGLAPESFDMWVNMENALAYLKRLDEAVAAYDQAFARNPKSGITLILKANVLEELNRWTDAAAAYAQAIDVDPTLRPALKPVFRGLEHEPAPPEIQTLSPNQSHDSTEPVVADEGLGHDQANPHEHGEDVLVSPANAPSSVHDANVEAQADYPASSLTLTIGSVKVIVVEKKDTDYHWIKNRIERIAEYMGIVPEFSRVSTAMEIDTILGTPDSSLSSPATFLLIANGVLSSTRIGYYGLESYIEQLWKNPASSQIPIIIYSTAPGIFEPRSIQLPPREASFVISQLSQTAKTAAEAFDRAVTTCLQRVKSQIKDLNATLISLPQDARSGVTASLAQVEEHEDDLIPSVSAPDRSSSPPEKGSPKTVTIVCAEEMDEDFATVKDRAIDIANRMSVQLDVRRALSTEEVDKILLMCENSVPPKPIMLITERYLHQNRYNPSPITLDDYITTLWNADRTTWRGRIPIIVYSSRLLPLRVIKRRRPGKFQVSKLYRGSGVPLDELDSAITAGLEYLANRHG